MTRPPLLLAVDVGGTTTAAGAVAPDGEVVLEERAPTHGEKPGGALALIDTLIARVRAAVERLGHEIRGIGVGVPGPVDTVAGRVSDHVPHAPDLAGVALAERLARRFGLPVFVDNDVNALALAEWTFGVARGVRSLVLLAPGTGFGAGIVLEGRLVRGAGGFGGELGHTPINFDGPRCFCGGRGCGAVYASGRGIAEAAQARVAGQPDAPLLVAAGGNPGAITAPLVFELAARGDPAAQTVVDDAYRALGAVVATVVNGLNPEIVVITGGIMTALAAGEARILEAAAEYALPQALAATRVRIVPGDKRVTIRGAAALVLYEMAMKEERR